MATININKMSRTQLGDLAKRVNARIETLGNDNLKAARQKVQAIAKQAGVSLSDLVGNTPATNSASATPRAPKYRDPQDHSLTWSGRGKRPGWFNKALAGGTKMEAMQIH